MHSFKKSDYTQEYADYQLFLKLKQLELEKPLYFDPFDQNNINHLVQVSLEIFLCRFENSSPGARGNNKIYINE